MTIPQNVNLHRLLRELNEEEIKKLEKAKNIFEEKNEEEYYEVFTKLQETVFSYNRVELEELKKLVLDLEYFGKQKQDTIFITAEVITELVTEVLGFWSETKEEQRDFLLSKLTLVDSLEKNLEIDVESFYNQEEYEFLSKTSEKYNLSKILKDKRENLAEYFETHELEKLLVFLSWYIVLELDYINL